MGSPEEQASTTFVDVGIPTHGRPQYLQRAIESVLGQTLVNWRLTICEDGSGDVEVVRVAQRYLGDQRVRFLCTGARAGAAKTHSALLRAGDAPYVALLHDDDEWDPTFLERRFSFLQRNLDCGAVFSPNLEIDHDNQVVRRVAPKFTEGVQKKEEFVPSLLLRNPTVPSAMMFRRAALEAVGDQFDPRYGLLYDYELFIRLALEFPIGYVHAYDVSYRLHQQQSRLKAGAGREHWQLLDEVDYRLRDYPHLRLAPRQRARQQAGFILSVALDDVESGDRRAALVSLRRALTVHKSSVLDVRVWATVLGLLIGSERLAAVRGAMRRRDVSLHRRPH